MQISIITVVKDDMIGLSKTFNSVKKILKNISSWIIIDGNNGTSLNEDIYLQSKINNNIKIVEGHDKGIYNAMNIGASYAFDDDYLWWLNAGDEFLDLPCFDDKYDIAFFRVFLKEKNKVSQLNIEEWHDGRGLYPVSIFWHQGFIIKKKIYIKYLYNESLSMASDLLLMSLCQKNENYCINDKAIAIYSLDGISNVKYIKWIKEYVAVAQMLGINIWNMPYRSYIMMVKIIVKNIISLLKLHEKSIVGLCLLLSRWKCFKK